jgi:hypothetical protein
MALRANGFILSMQSYFSKITRLAFETNFATTDISKLLLLKFTRLSQASKTPKEIEQASKIRHPAQSQQHYSVRRRKTHDGHC